MDGLSWQKTRIAMEVLNGFVVWFGNRDYVPKTIKVYVEAVQSLAKYYNIPISPITPAPQVPRVHHFKSWIENHFWGHV